MKSVFFTNPVRFSASMMGALLAIWTGATLPAAAAGPCRFYGDEFDLTALNEPSNGDSRVAALADGRFVTVRSGMDLSGSDFFRARFFRYDGQSIGNEFVLTERQGADDTLPSVDALNDGGFALGWHHRDDGQLDLYHRLFDADGRNRTSVLPVHGQTPGTDEGLKIVPLRKGYLAVWRSSSDDPNAFSLGILGRRFDANGRPVANAGWINRFKAGHQAVPTATALKDGRVVVAYVDWRVPEPTDIRLTVLDPTGRPILADVLVNPGSDGTQIEPSVAALPDGRFAVAWVSDISDGGKGIYVQIFKLNRRTLVREGEPLLVERTEGAVTRLAQPKIVGTAGGGIFASWIVADGTVDGGFFHNVVRGRFYGPDGAEQGVPFDIGEGVFYTTWTLHIDQSRLGGIFITWREGVDTSEGLLIISKARVVVSPVEATVRNDEFPGTPCDDEFDGGGGNDVIRGGDGSDRLSGGQGDDILNGDVGNDVLIGGLGRDRMTGGDGRDTFVFANGDTGSTPAQADIVVDFQPGQRDRIDLGSVDADVRKPGDQAFAFIRTRAFTGVPGQLRYVLKRAETVIEGDTNGDGVADLAIRLFGRVPLRPFDIVR